MGSHQLFRLGHVQVRKLLSYERVSKTFAISETHLFDFAKMIQFKLQILPAILSADKHMFLLSGFHAMHCQLWQNRGLTSQVQYLGHPQARFFVLKSGMNILDVPAVFICFPHHSHFLCCSMLFPAIFIFCRFAAGRFVSPRVSDPNFSSITRSAFANFSVVKVSKVAAACVLRGAPRGPRSWRAEKKPTSWRSPN